MKASAISLAALLLLAGCGASDEDEVAAAIRDGLSERGTVLNVDVTRQSEDRMTAVALLRNHAGTEVRMNCTVSREGEKSLMRQGFNWRCQPA